MRFAKFFRAFFLLMPLLLFENVSAIETDDYTPEVTARVARISFLRGEVQIKRADGKDWERATLNLPLVEGDQIATDRSARVEIQFDRDSFLRLSENSYLKIPTLRDEGVALSLPQGTLSLRVLNFDKDRSYFELDAPQTTVSVQKVGLYRIDAGDDRSNEVRITVTDSGEARVYSDNSGFTLRNGRSSRIYLSGSYAGEWETSDASRYADEWDGWVLERDEKVAKKLREAYYDRFYDRDIYGAEDLNEHGEWINTRKYGWVWRPYRTATSSYANWSPYRYGHWRWIPPYGWTWVNDEPWGWATYHHGRWVYVSGDWVWSPYAYHRPRRSWWSPALVVVTYSGSLICWYPLPYSYGYYNYNSYYYSKKYVDKRKYYNNTTIIVNPTPTPNPSPTPTGPLTPPRSKNTGILEVPPTAVVAIGKEDFGLIRTGKQTATLEVAKKVLSAEPSFESPPILPIGLDGSVRTKNEIVVEKPRLEKIDSEVKTGVIERQPGTKLDEQIRRTKVFDERKAIEPVKEDREPEPVKAGIEGKGGTRNTGAVERFPSRTVTKRDETDENNSEPIKQAPTRSTGSGKSDENEPVRKPREAPPVFQPRKDDDNQSPPIYNPPAREKPRYDPPPQKPREEPRYDPPPSKPREEPPRKQEPPRSEPPPRKSEPEVKPPSKNDKDN